MLIKVGRAKEFPVFTLSRGSDMITVNKKVFNVKLQGYPSNNGEQKIIQTFFKYHLGSCERHFTLFFF